jgi:hypothetical protein
MGRQNAILAGLHRFHPLMRHLRMPRLDPARKLERKR